VELCQKKQKRCTEHEREEAGDLWDHTAIAADSKLIVALVVGKHTQEQTHTLVHDAKRRLRAGHLPALFTDGYDGYESAILEAFGRCYPAPKTGLKGRPLWPVLRWPQGLAYGQVQKSAQGQSNGIDLKVVRGKAHLQHVLSLLGYHKINTSVVEVRPVGRKETLVSG
jgi:hypothetical protein